MDDKLYTIYCYQYNFLTREVTCHEVKARKTSKLYKILDSTDMLYFPYAYVTQLNIEEMPKVYLPIYGEGEHLNFGSDNYIISDTKLDAETIQKYIAEKLKSAQEKRRIELSVLNTTEYWLHALHFNKE